MSEQDSTTTEAAPEDVQGATTDEQPSDTLGEPGKKALEAERKARREAEKQLRDFQSRLAAMEEAQNKTAEERAALEKQRELEQAALAKANERILAAELRAAATGKLADPTDALTFIDRSGFEVGDDGSVDADAISDAIADLVSKKPYLAARREDPGPGSADGGARDVSRPRQWTREEVAKARKEGRYADIDQARHDGLLRDVLAGADT